MQRKFKSRTAALKFVKATGGKIKQGKACKLKDGTKARWYTLSWPKKAKKKRR